MDVNNVLSDVLKRKDIYTFFSRSAFEKAYRYQAQGRVTALEISDDLTHIRARVQGEASKPYRVEIELDFTPGRLADLAGECSCPMAVNCKHVAATVLEALSDKVPPASLALPVKSMQAAGTAPAPSAPVLTYDVTTWLDNVGKAVRGDDYPADLSQRLLYCLQPSQDTTRMPILAVSLISVRVLKSGEFGGNYTRPSLSDFTPERAPKYCRDTDIDILAQLSFEAKGYYYSGHRVRSAELVERMIATGRTYWLDHKGSPLRWAEKREGRIEWHQAGKNGVAPQLTVPGATVLNAEPPVYVDEAARSIGQVELNLPARLAYQLLSAPAIPRAQVAEVARRLGEKLPEVHHGLLPGPPATAVKVEENPVPILRLKLGRAGSSAYYYRDVLPDRMPVAHLSFRYGPVEIEPSERANRIEVFQGGQVYAVSRRRLDEKNARKRMADFGFLEARSVYPYLDVGHLQDLTFAKPHDWLDFLSLRLADLSAEGFEVHVDDDFPFRLADSADVFDAEFESSGIDWFELGLGIEIDGERRDLTSILAALVSAPGFPLDQIRLLAENGDHFYLPLADGRHLSLAADRFLPLVLALHTLNLHGAVADKAGKIRLLRADIVPLLGLESEEFVFKGADNLRRLAGLLHARGLADISLPKTFKASLRPYQAQGLAWLDLLRESGLGGVLADDMGLGKTIQTLALLALEKARGNLTIPALVVAPTSLMTNWFNEAQKFAPELKVLVLAWDWPQADLRGHSRA